MNKLTDTILDEKTLSDIVTLYEYDRISDIYDNKVRHIASIVRCHDALYLINWDIELGCYGHPRNVYKNQPIEIAYIKKDNILVEKEVFTYVSIDNCMSYTANTN